MFFPYTRSLASTVLLPFRFVSRFNYHIQSIYMKRKTHDGKITAEKEAEERRQMESGELLACHVGKKRVREKCVGVALMATLRAKTRVDMVCA